MKIKVICEGKTEKAFKPHLIKFLQTKLAGKMPKLDFTPCGGALPTDDKLNRMVFNLLNTGKAPYDAVIALTDVYPKFADAEEAKKEMREWVGNQAHFYPHVACHDFEAWLLPYWDKIEKIVGKKRAPFAHNPETVNGDNPPAHRLKAFYETGRQSYQKITQANRILTGEDLLVAIEACPELKAFVNTILQLCKEDCI